MFRTIVLLVFLSFFVPGIAEESNGPWNPMEMVAVWPIQIEVETSPDGEKAGLTEMVLYEAVELALRRNKIQIGRGIRALFQGSYFPILSVRADVLRVVLNGHGIGYAYHVEIEVWKWIALQEHHDRQSSIPGTFWETGATGTTGNADSLRAQVRQYVSEKTDEFSLAYHRALE